MVKASQPGPCQQHRSNRDSHSEIAMCSENEVAIIKIETTRKPTKESRCNCAQRPNHQHDPCGRTPIGLVAHHTKRLGCKCGNNHGDWKVDHHNMQFAEPDEQTLAKALIAIIFCLVVLHHHAMVMAH